MARIHRFELLGVLGRGGAGLVHVAYDPQLRRKVALKVFPPHDDPRTAARMKREARLAASLSHPHVVTVFDVGESEGRVWVAMELFEGHTLRTVLATRAHRWPELSPYFLPVAAGIEAAHRQGIVHRDIKPENILVASDGRVAVSDFGVATMSATTPNVPNPERRVSGGTPAYMSPEQLDGRDVGPPSDQFSFCVTLYEALVGERPFVGRTLAELRERMRGGPDAALRGRLPPTLAEVVARGLSFSPEDRYPSMSALVDALPRARRARRWPIALAGGLVVSAVWASAGEPDPMCTGGQGKIETVWNDAREAELAPRYEGSGISRHAWGRIVPALDQSATAWSEAHRTVCEDGRSGSASAAALDRKMWCLSKQRMQLESTIAALAEASETTIHNAAGLLDALPTSQDCLALDANGAAPSGDPQVIALQREIIETQVNLHAGRYVDAVTRAAALALRAESLAEPRLAAQALMTQGSAEIRSGHPRDGVRSLELALFIAMHEGDVLTQIHAALNLAPLAADRDPEQGRRWLARARALLEAGDFGPRLEATVLDREATMLAVAGDFAAAQDRFETAYARLQKAGDTEHEDAARLLTNMAELAALQGDLDEAEATHRRVVALRGALHGTGHPAYATSLAALGTTSIRQGRYDDARAQLEQALQILAASTGVENPSYAKTEAVLGAVLLEQGEHDAARPHLEHAHRVLERVDPSAAGTVAVNLRLLEERGG